MYEDYEYYKEKAFEVWDPFDNSRAYEEMWSAEDIDYLMYKELEHRYFEELEGKGKNAHAYNHDYDNILIMQMREEGKTLREIAEQFGCSPSTIRNRLRILGMK